METDNLTNSVLLKTGYAKIISLFYDNKQQKLHLREIARRTGLNGNSATRFLKKLKDEKILISEKDGNLKKFSISKNKKTFLFFTFFDVERFENLPLLRKNAITYFLNELKEKPLIAVLFGSTAKGLHNKTSDIDLFLIVNKKIETKEAENYVDAQTGIRISSFQIRYSDFLNELKMKKDQVLQSAINTGYPVLNNMKYYEETLR
jgi:predicted nucleotidyltransferase